MRIIPWEVLPFSANDSLTTLRKEIFMHDYHLTTNKQNIAMDLFLGLGRDYFILVLKKWVIEMQKRHLYVNSLMIHYANCVQYKKVINTNIFLIIECLMQWDLKGFTPYQTDHSWFEIINYFIKKSPLKLSFNQKKYQTIKAWYKSKFMQLNHHQLLKPHKLNMTLATNYLATQLLAT